MKIAKDPSFEKHLNKYPVIYLDLTEFTTRFHDSDIVEVMDAELKADVTESFSDVPIRENDDLMGCLIRIAIATGKRFVFIFDEWDAICREFMPGTTGKISQIRSIRS